jgi:hypothetical protein
LALNILFVNKGTYTAWPDVNLNVKTIDFSFFVDLTLIPIIVDVKPLFEIPGPLI